MGWLIAAPPTQKARWVLLVLILAVGGFGALMTQLFLWEYGEYSDLHLFGVPPPKSSLPLLLEAWGLI